MKCYLVHLYIRVTIWNYTRKQTKLRVNKKGSLDFFAPMHHEYFFIFFISTYVNKKSKQKQSTCCLKIIIYASFLTHIHEQCKCFMNKHHTLLRYHEYLFLFPFFFEFWLSFGKYREHLDAVGNYKY